MLVTLFACFVFVLTALAVQVPSARHQLHPVTNLTGQPALSVPAGYDDQGLPVGVQLVGPRWSEPALLDIARALETAEVLPGFETPSHISG